MEKVEILLASYNGQQYIAEMIESILAQDFQAWHLTVSDDQSSDGTDMILESFSQRYPEKITHYRSGKRFGNAQDHFMHLLVEFHDAPYIMFCDQDDVWHKDKVRKTLAKMQETEMNRSQPVLVHTDLRVVDSSLNELHPSFIRSSGIDGNRTQLNQLLMQNTVTGCTMMINAALASLVICCLPDKGIAMHDWWIALTAAAFGKIGYLKEPTIDYRQHGSNIVGAKNIKSFSYIQKRLSAEVIQNAIFTTSEQARLLIDSYKSFLSTQAMDTLKGCAALRESGYFARRKLFVRHKLYKAGTLRCIAQFLLG